MYKTDHPARAASKRTSSAKGTQGSMYDPTDGPTEGTGGRDGIRQEEDKGGPKMPGAKR